MQPDDFGPALENAMDPDRRRALGAHYTPRPLAEGLIERALSGRQAPTVGDPSCGAGALLLAAGRALVERGLTPRDALRHLWGADIDPAAIAAARAALAGWAGVEPPAAQLTVADALASPLPWPRLDVVVGNPPFLSQLSTSTARDAGARAAARARWGAAVRPYTDTGGLFLLTACDLVGDGGVVAMLQPRSVLAARDAAAVRDAIDARARLREVWLPEARFEAAVEVCAPILEVGSPGGARPWSEHLASAQGTPAWAPPPGPTLGQDASVAASFRSEYYGLVPHVRERRGPGDGAPVITTGLVDLGSVAWGARSARIARQDWTAPVVDRDRLEGRAAAWAERTRGPKIVLAGQTRVIEVAVDEDGDWIPLTPLVVVLAAPARLWRLAAALASPPVTAWAAARSAGTALTPTALKLGAPLVREVPLPTDAIAWQQGADALRSHELDAFAAAMTRAYGADEALLTWWRARVNGTWSRPPSGR